MIRQITKAVEDLGRRHSTLPLTRKLQPSNTRPSVHSKLNCCTILAQRFGGRYVVLGFLAILIPQSAPALQEMHCARRNMEGNRKGYTASQGTDESEPGSSCMKNAQRPRKNRCNYDENRRVIFAMTVAVSIKHSRTSAAIPYYAKPPR